MINDEVSNRAANIEVQVAKASANEILKQLRKLLLRANQHGGLNKLIKAEGTEVKLKDMVNKGQLEEINVKDGELKELRKELNRHVCISLLCEIKKLEFILYFFKLKILKLWIKHLKMYFQKLKPKKRIKNLFVKQLINLKKWQKVVFPTIKSKINKRNKAYDR